MNTDERDPRLLLPRGCSVATALLVVVIAIFYLLITLGLVGCAPQYPGGEVVVPTPEPTATVTSGTCVSLETLTVYETPNTLAIVDEIPAGEVVMHLVENRDGWTQVVTSKFVYGWVKAEGCR